MDSRRRPEIRQPPPDPPAHGVNTIIDAARDCLEWLAKNEPQATISLCDQLVQDEVILLKRLAVHTISYLAPQNLSWDKVIDWIIDKGLIYHPQTKPEVMQTARSAFREASPEAKERLLNSLDHYPPEAK